MPFCLIGLGSNLGDRQCALEEATARLAIYPGIHLVTRSSWISTEPIGGPAGQAPYLNGAALIETPLAPEPLLGVIEQIEAELGRQRSQRWGPRTIDLDLLLYDRVVRAGPGVVLPHPRMAWRRFVLEPASEVAADMIHPTTGWTIKRLWDNLRTSAFYVAITGSIGAGKTHLAELVAARAGGHFLAEKPDLARLAAFYHDPASHAWEMELEFLDERARLLEAGRPQWSNKARPTVSDFWFDQSAAFARAWLPPKQLPEYLARWEEARRGVVQPRLTVLLEVQAGELAERIRRRGRGCEQGLTEEQLLRIAEAIRDEATRPDKGPLLRLGSGDSDANAIEVLAAIESCRA
jgi:2-amino-4-hydroxy-6-hydroxymethyldihydropteridine diphosphokinase